MKKLLTGVLVLTLWLTMAVPAFAEGTEINQDSALKEGETAVSFNVDPVYTVTIPEKVELTQTTTGGTVTYEQTAKITASAGVKLLKGYELRVTMAPSGEDTTFTLATDEGATLDYTVTAGDNTTAVASGGLVATFETSTAAQESELKFSAGNPKYSGSYSDEVTFTISVVDSQSGN